MSASVARHVSVDYSKSLICQAPKFPPCQLRVQQRRPHFELRIQNEILKRTSLRASARTVIGTPVVSRTQLQEDGKTKPGILAASSALLFQAALPCLSVLAAVEEDGDNFNDVLMENLIAFGVVVTIYFLVAPPVIYNYLRLRWFLRGTLETYFQFMLMFLFFPAMLLWAPFINFRQFPRDPSEIP